MSDGTSGNETAANGDFTGVLSGRKRGSTDESMRNIVQLALPLPLTSLRPLSPIDSGGDDGGPVHASGQVSNRSRSPKSTPMSLPSWHLDEHTRQVGLAGIAAARALLAAGGDGGRAA